MLNHLSAKNLTVFSSIDLQFSPHLNIIVGENGTGKTHLLKVLYAVLTTSYGQSRKSTSEKPTKTAMQTLLAEKLVGVFRAESLGRLTRRNAGRERCQIEFGFDHPQFNLAFSFANNSKTEVVLSQTPDDWLDVPSVYLPTRELLTIFPNFVAVYDSHYLEFEETWRDTCSWLGAPLQRGINQEKSRNLLEPLETAMGGSLTLGHNGRFYLGSLEMPLVAEGQRKLAMLAQLIATGVLSDQSFLFWDEPEANLNPVLIKAIASSIINLSKAGIQIFIATHSLFLLRELEILLMNPENSVMQSESLEIKPRFFGLKFYRGVVKIEQGDDIDNIGDLAVLDEQLMQSERFLESRV